MAVSTYTADPATGTQVNVVPGLGQPTAAASAALVTMSRPDDPLITAVNVLSAVATKYKYVATASTNANFIKAAPGSIKSITFVNMTASAKFVRIYDKASAPVPASDIPDFTVSVPVSAGSNPPYTWGTSGYTMTNGIAFDITGAIGDTDTTATAAGDVKIVVTYI
jgi:hypothetical protein